MYCSYWSLLFYTHPQLGISISHGEIEKVHFERNISKQQKNFPHILLQASFSEKITYSYALSFLRTLQNEC